MIGVDSNVIDRLMAAQATLATRPVDRILALLDRVCARWLDHADPIRREAEERLAESSGLAPAMLRRGLDDMIRRTRAIPALLDADLGSRYALDRFVERASGLRSRAFGPGLLTCLFSGNVPGIPAFDIALALALKSACLVRVAAAEPVFAPLFARSITEVDAGLGEAVHVTRWPYDDPLPYQRAGAVLAYGADASIAAIRQLVPPEVRFLGHGHKISFAVVAAEAATEQTARRLARDVAMYDQQGCVSPHMAFVERGGPLSPAGFAEACAAAFAQLQGEMPRAKLTLEEAAALRAARDEAEFTADAFHGSPGDLAWAVIHSETPAFLPSPLNRLLRTYAISSLSEVEGLVAPHAAYLQTIAYAGPEARRLALAETLGRLGASRIAPIGQAQQPHPLWRHDGAPTAASLVRWVEIEPEEDPQP